MHTLAHAKRVGHETKEVSTAWIVSECDDHHSDLFMFFRFSAVTEFTWFLFHGVCLSFSCCASSALFPLLLLCFLFFGPPVVPALFSFYRISWTLFRISIEVVFHGFSFSDTFSTPLFILLCSSFVVTSS
jgi:hypothetical protein